MKLNYKRTILVGFAFFLIMAFWQAYEVIVPLMLVNKFGMNQTLSGLIMALDNVLAVFMLPIFGALSDKSHNKRGRRTPFIFIGTLVAIVAFIGLSFADNIQLNQIKADNTPQEFQEQLFEANTVVINAERSVSHDKTLDREYKVKDYASMVKFNKKYDNLTEEEKAEVKTWFIGLNEDSVYYYDGEEKIYIVSDEIPDDENAVVANAYTNLIASARNNHAWEITKKNPLPLIFFIIILLIVLIAMAVFRSPAVALMPDVTIKPLRSQGNAVINLMGTVGAMIVLVLGLIFGTGKVVNQMGSFTGYIIAVCAVMLFGLLMFIFFVKEPKWSAEMEAESKRLGIDTESDEIEDLVDSDVKESSVGDGSTIKDLAKKDKGKFLSLILLLVSVALWFTGYNAASSKYSLYATNILHKDYNMTLLMAQAVAIISFIPAGWISSKIGRKNSILIGSGILTAVFLLIATFDANTPKWVIDVVFSFGGIGWASINVNSFPMVVELAKGGNVGKYTGYYYTASMAAQIITPVLSGFIMDLFGSMKPLFYYCTVFFAISILTMAFVRHGDNLMMKKQKKELKAQGVANEDVTLSEDQKEDKEDK